MDKRVRKRLSIDETDATWRFTATNLMFRFHNGRWQCSKNVYYGADEGWFNWGSEPASGDDEFIEMLPDQPNDPRFAHLDLRMDNDQD